LFLDLLFFRCDLYILKEKMNTLKIKKNRLWFLIILLLLMQSCENEIIMSNIKSNNNDFKIKYTIKTYKSNTIENKNTLFIYGLINTKNTSNANQIFNILKNKLIINGNVSIGCYIDSIASIIDINEFKPNESKLFKVYWVFENIENYNNNDIDSLILSGLYE